MSKHNEMQKLSQNYGEPPKILIRESENDLHTKKVAETGRDCLHIEKE